MSFQRLQLIVMFRATMSTVFACSTGSRCGLEMTRNSTLFSSPKIAFATALIMSMSKPSILPVNGLRDPRLRLSAETPAISRPRSWIVFIVVPSGIARGAGSPAGSGAYDCSALVQFCAAGGAGDFTTGGALVGTGVAW